MLHDFLTSNRGELISRCEAKVAKRSPKVSSTDDHGAPLFLQQLADTLYREQLTTVRTESVTERTPANTEIGRAAALHGAELQRSGYSVDQVVHDYGDVCQAVTELAFEQNALITVNEFSTLNRCLDNAIADAVTAYASGLKDAISDRATKLSKWKSSTSEQQRLINLAIQTVSAIQTGGANGTSATTLLSTLCDLRDLIDQSR
jgi:hypothetical protein